MVKTIIYTIVLAGLLGGDAWGEKKDNLKLYQIGTDGNYCLSITRDKSGCVSGLDDGGTTINTLDITKGKNIIFENLSDAFHDMKLSGRNAADLPAQGPNAAAAQKEMAVEDMNKERITCSFHGDQLGVGYRVPKGDVAVGGGHKDPVYNPQGNPDGAGQNTLAVDTTPQKIVRTGLADVSSEVLAKGRPAEVQRLITARPDLATKLQEVRPLLAAELGGRGTNTKGAGYVAGRSKSPAGALDQAFGASGGKVPTLASGKTSATGKGGSVAGGGSGGGDGDGRLLASTEISDSSDDELIAVEAAPLDTDEILAPEKEGTRDLAARSSSLGLGVPDRTKLKGVDDLRKKGMVASGPDWNSWLLFTLLLSVMLVTFMVFFATRSKKEEEKARARAVKKHRL